MNYVLPFISLRMNHVGNISNESTDINKTFVYIMHPLLRVLDKTDKDVNVK
jgi:hypothetical protein